MTAHSALTRRLIEDGLRPPAVSPEAKDRALDQALTEARAVLAMLKRAQAAATDAECNDILRPALQRVCVLRDHVDIAERASR
jgi:hypothetical protein